MSSLFKMKRVFLIISLFGLFSCDKGESMDVFIKNSTANRLKVNFISTEIDELNKSLEIESNQEGLFTSFESTTSSVFLSFIDNDSIYIEDSSNEVLKVFKEDTPGKNIYNVDEYWSVSEPSNNHFVYTYEITEEDLE